MSKHAPEKIYKSITLGKNIRAIRKSMNCTQEQFAEKIDITPQFLSQVERGIAGMSISTAIKICNEANCSPSFLFKDIIKTANTFDKYSLLSATNKQIIEQLIDILLNFQT